MNSFSTIYSPEHHIGDSDLQLAINVYRTFWLQVNFFFTIFKRMYTNNIILNLILTIVFLSNQN